MMAGGAALAEDLSDREDDVTVEYSAEVQAAIDELMAADDDPLYRADFDVTAYINQLFPTEQSLSRLDETMAQVNGQMADVDAEMADLVQTQSSCGQAGQTALGEATKAIQQLFSVIREIKAKTDMSESVVKEITKDIKELDACKRNLTTCITTLHHLHILLGGVDSLGADVQRRRYGDVAAQLPAMLNVLVLFEPYMAVAQVKLLADQVYELKRVLSEQVTVDFNNYFGPVGTNRPAINMVDLCRVVSVLDAAVKSDLCASFIHQQLREYAVLFDDNQDAAWLDNIGDRFKWFVRFLVAFEGVGGGAQSFPPDWQMGRRLAVEFCAATRDGLDKVMLKRQAELDAKLLAHAVQCTATFESQLCRRFPSTAAAAVGAADAAFAVSFDGLIRRVFDKFVGVYVDAQDKNLAEFVNQCASRFRGGDGRPRRELCTTAQVLQSSGQLFQFFKRIIQEATTISTSPVQPLTLVIPVFRKYIREYAHSCLTAFLPKISTSQTSSTAGLIQSLLKEGDVARLTTDEQFLTCCILATADWCAATVHILQEKLKEKMGGDAAQADMGAELDVMHGVASSAQAALVQDLEAACDAALQALAKTNWAAVEAVGDESSYVAALRSHLAQNASLLREYLAEYRKYFASLCMKFAQQLTAKFVGALLRCKPCSVAGAEQLLLDATLLKGFLGELPNVGAAVRHNPSSAYKKLVDEGMGRAERILKLVMSPVEPHDAFISNALRLLPGADAAELQRILEMKAVRRADQAILMQLYREKSPVGAVVEGGAFAGLQHHPSAPLLSLASNNDSRIKKLEKLVRKRL